MIARIIRAETKHSRKLAHIALLVLVLAVALYWPALNVLYQAAFRRNPIRFQDLEVDVPSSWMVAEENSKLKAWKPCLTRFCDSPEAEVSISISRFESDESLLRKNAEQVLARLGFVSGVSRSNLASTSGATECFESNQGRPGLQSMAVCFNPELRFIATAGEARKTSVEGYRILSSIRDARGK